MMKLVNMLGLGSSSFKESRGSSPLFGNTYYGDNKSTLQTKKPKKETKIK